MRLVLVAQVVAGFTLSHRIASEAVAGCLGGICKTALVYPLDLEATRREASASFRTVESLRDRYRGLGVTLLAAPFYALLFHAAYVYCYLTM